MSKKEQRSVNFCKSVIKVSKFDRVDEVCHVGDVLLDKYMYVVISCERRHG